MSNIIKNEIISPAWEMIKDDSKIKKIYFIAGILSIVFLTLILTYQSIYTYVEIFGKKEEALVIILNFFHSSYILEVAIAFIIFIIIYFILTPIFEGGLIKYIENKDKNKILDTSQVISLGLYNFLPIFKYTNLFSEFKFISILNGYLFTIRFVGIEYISYISYTFLIAFIIGTAINILFSYAKYIIILEQKPIFKAIGESSKIAVLNFNTTIKLYFLMFILNIRVIINFIIFLAFPIILVLAISIITSKIFLYLTVAIIIILFIAFILFLGYLTSVLEIFITSIWYFAYKKGKDNLKEIKES